MRKIHLLLTALLFCSITIVPANASTVPPNSGLLILPEAMYKKISSLTIKDIQKQTGKKLTLKQKISFLILKQKLKHRPAEKNPGQTALTFGIVGLTLFVIGLFVPYVILGSLIASIIAVVTGSSAKRKNPDDRKAQSGKLLGWITLGLIGFVLILAAIVVASWGIW